MKFRRMVLNGRCFKCVGYQSIVRAKAQPDLWSMKPSHNTSTIGRAQNIFFRFVQLLSSQESPNKNIQKHNLWICLEIFCLKIPQDEDSALVCARHHCFARLLPASIAVVWGPRPYEVQHSNGHPRPCRTFGCSVLSFQLDEFPSGLVQIHRNPKGFRKVLKQRTWDALRASQLNFQWVIPNPSRLSKSVRPWAICRLRLVTSTIDVMFAPQPHQMPLGEKPCLRKLGMFLFYADFTMPYEWWCFQPNL